MPDPEFSVRADDEWDDDVSDASDKAAGSMHPSWISVPAERYRLMEKTLEFTRDWLDDIRPDTEAILGVVEMIEHINAVLAPPEGEAGQ